MINKKIEKIINEQINAELWSAYLYLSMSAWLEGQNLPGFANWMRIQWQEETAHAMKFFDYLNERGGSVKLTPIAKVPTEWKDVVEVFEETLKHERIVTDLIHKIADLAMEEKDHATYQMNQWFVEEQVEEEASAEAILEQVKMVAGHGHGILMIDRTLAERTFTDPTKE